MPGHMLLAAGFWLALIGAVWAQNLKVESGAYGVFHGTLVWAIGQNEAGEMSFPAVELAVAFDLVCPADDDLCEPAEDQHQLHLAISGDARWEAFESGLARPVRVTGEVYPAHTIHHQRRAMLTVDEIEVLPGLSISAANGRYADDPALCSPLEGESASDNFLAASIVDGSIIVSGHEFSCTGTQSRPDGAADIVTAACFQEGEPFDTTMRIEALSGGGMRIDETELHSCPSTAIMDPSVRTIDLRRPHADLLYYGSRVGMEVTLARIAGQGTSRARIEAEHSPYNAYRFCALYASAPTKACIDRELQLELATSVTANCDTGRFSDFHGTTYRFAGPSAGDDYPEFDIVEAKSGRVLDGSSASGYGVALAIYEALCKPENLSRPLLDAQAYIEEFDRLRAWQGKSLFNAGGVIGLPVMRFASSARPDIGRRVFSTMGSTRLDMFDAVGFASRNGASVLIDFERRDILLCLSEEKLPSRPVSYRFGTMLDGGLDGFGPACPTSIEAALAEYLPLVGDNQTLWVSDDEDDGFAGEWSDTDRHPDLLGLGKVIYFDQCSNDPAFNPEWINIWGGNRVMQGRFEAGGLLCQIAESRYDAQADSLDVELICSTAGYESGRVIQTIARTPTGRLTVDGEPVNQCASHYFATIEAFGG